VIFRHTALVNGTIPAPQCLEDACQSSNLRVAELRQLVRQDHIASLDLVRLKLQGMVIVNELHMVLLEGLVLLLQNAKPLDCELELLLLAFC
jgi:hypothetical protein